VDANRRSSLEKFSDDGGQGCASLWERGVDRECFAKIRVWHPSSRPSAIRCGSCEIGPGAEQQYTLKDRKNYIHERVVDWQEGRSYRIEVFGGTVPMDEILAELAVEPEGAGSLLRMPIRYRPRWGLLGRLIEPVLLRPILPHMMRRVIGGLAAKAEVLALLRAA
jgi:hypothetical protein